MLFFFVIDEHKEYSDNQRYPSSTDKSFAWQDLDLSDVEGLVQMNIIIQF